MTGNLGYLARRVHSERHVQVEAKELPAALTPTLLVPALSRLGIIRSGLLPWQSFKFPNPANMEGSVRRAARPSAENNGATCGGDLTPPRASEAPA